METQFIPTWAVSVLLLLLAIAVSVWALKSSADADLEVDEEDDPDDAWVSGYCDTVGALAGQHERCTQGWDMALPGEEPCDCRCHDYEYDDDGFTRDGYLVDGGECEDERDRS